MMETIRAFIAINLEVSAIRRVATAQRALRTSKAIVEEKLSWVPPPNMHVTLRFLGSHLDPALVPAISDGLKNIVASFSPIYLTLGPIDAFPNQQRARIIMVRVQDESGQLDAMAQQVEQLAQQLGLPPEKRPFHAHVTLARVRKPANVSAWFAAIGQHNLNTTWVTECTLYESSLTPKGAEYRALERFSIPKGRPGKKSKRPPDTQPSPPPSQQRSPTVATTPSQAEATPTAPQRRESTKPDADRAPARDTSQSTGDDQP